MLNNCVLKCIFITYILLFGSSCINSSKLNEVVLRDIGQIFNGHNNVSATHNANASNSEGNGENQNVWQNEGFICANATQITNSFGSKIGISTKLLLATKASSLSTHLNNFAHTFLVIKFSSIIGHTENQPQQVLDESSTTPVPYLSDEMALSSFPEARDQEFHSSTLSYPQDSLPNSGMSDNQKLPTISNSPPVKSLEQNVFPMVISPVLQVPHPPPPPPPGSTILKLNAEGSDGHQIIEIALDPEVLAKSEPPLPPAFKVSQISDQTSINGGADNPPPAEISLNRRKRELNSEEMISQIHKILTITKNMKNDQNKEANIKPRLKTIQEEITSAQETQGADEFKLVKDEALVSADGQKSMSIKGLNSAKKLSYQTWRASMDKSFRPPGFYVMVDEKVVYDNFEGVWQSSTSPTVMGRWSSPKKNGIWNDTAIMLQFDEIPDKNIKISFEWEPLDPTAYLFLSNISISTYGANASDANIGPQYAGDSNNIFGGANNRNITLFVVLKTPTAEHVIKMGDKPEVVEQRVVHLEPNIAAIPTANPLTTTMLPKPVTKDKPAQPKSNPLSSGGNTGLIVACVVGCLSAIILIFLVHKKLQIKKSPNRQSHSMYIAEL